MSKEVKPNILDKTISVLSPKWGLSRLRDRKMIELAGSAFKSAEITRLRGDWKPFNDSASPSGYDLSVIRKRSRDANRNDPIASGTTDTMKINIVGSGLKPQSKIRADVLSITETKAEDLRRQAESCFRKFAPRAGSDNRLDFDELQFLAIAKIIEDGETIVLPTWANEKWRPYGRCLEMLESERLISPKRAKNNQNIKDGIKFGSRGEPLRYYITRSDKLNEEPTVISAFDSKGRPKVLHIFPTKRPGQRRGVPFFSPVLSYFKDLADYLEAEVVAARVAACLAVFITKQDAMTTAINMATGTESGTNNRIQGIEPGLVGYLNPGESINVVDPKRPGDSFGPFVESLLRIIGTSLNLPYELLIKDFSKTNYSSARAALLEGRRSFMTWRNWFARKFCQPVWDMVLEEAFLRGDFQAPDFYKFRHEYTQSIWIGGGWGWVDPVKEVDAARKAIDYGFSTLADENAAQGKDWEETIQQRKREIDLEKAINVMSAAKGADNTPDEKGGDNETEEK